LLTKGVKINEDATFAQFAKAIRSIPSEIVISKGEMPGKISYEYHYHTDGQGKKVDADMVKSGREGGCYTKAVYHTHTDACKETVTKYTYQTDDNVRKGQFIKVSNGEYIHRYRCEYCGLVFENSNSSHDEYTTDPQVVIDRHGWVYEEEKVEQITCGHKEKELLGYSKTCKYTHGQVVKATVTFEGNASKSSKVKTSASVASSKMAVNSSILNFSFLDGNNAFAGFDDEEDEDLLALDETEEMDLDYDISPNAFRYRIIELDDELEENPDADTEQEGNEAGDISEDVTDDEGKESLDGEYI
jgi:hypothetical protein